MASTIRTFTGTPSRYDRAKTGMVAQNNRCCLIAFTRMVATAGNNPFGEEISVFSPVKVGGHVSQVTLLYRRRLFVRHTLRRAVVVNAQPGSASFKKATA